MKYPRFYILLVLCSLLCLYAAGCGTAPAGGGGTPADPATINPSNHVSSIDGYANHGSSLVLDSTGKPHIFFMDSEVTPPFVVWGKWTGYTWAFDDFHLAINASVGGLSAAMDSMGNIYLAVYYSGSLWVNKFNVSGGSGSGGEIDITVGTTVTYDAVSVALNSSGNPRISYYDNTNKDLKFARSDDAGATWDLSTVESNGDVGRFSSVVIDSNGTPEISYYDETNTDLKFAKWSGSDWVITTVESSTNDVGRYSSIALDGSGRPWISYYDNTNGKLKCASFEGTNWVIQEVDSGNVGLYTSLKIDGNGRPWISYYDNAGSLKLASWEGTAWVKQVIDSGNQTGQFSSLALDASGNPRISYIARAIHTLYYFWK